MAQMVKNLPAMEETQVQALVQEDHLEKGMATHSSILACRIPWTEEPGGLQSMGLQRVRHTTERLPLHLISVHFRGCRRDLVCLHISLSLGLALPVPAWTSRPMYQDSDESESVSL